MPTGAGTNQHHRHVWCQLVQVSLDLHQSAPSPLPFIGVKLKPNGLPVEL